MSGFMDEKFKTADLNKAFKTQIRWILYVHDENIFLFLYKNVHCG